MQLLQEYMITSSQDSPLSALKAVMGYLGKSRQESMAEKLSPFLPYISSASSPYISLKRSLSICEGSPSKALIPSFKASTLVP